MTQLVKKAREIRAKIEEYMIDGYTYDDAFDELTENDFALAKVISQLEDWSDSDSCTVTDGVIVEAYENVKDLMRWMPQVNVFYVTNCFKDVQILAREGFTNIAPANLVKYTDSKCSTVFSIRMERV